MKKQVLITAIAIGLTMSFGVQVFADTISQKQRQAITMNTDKLTKAEQELADMDEELIKVNTEIGLLSSQIKENNQRLLEVDSSIKSAEAEIKLLESDIKDKESNINNRIDNIYKDDPVKRYMEILKASDSMKDFIQRVRSNNKALKEDRESVEDLTSKREQLNRRIEKLENDKVDLTNLTSDNEIKSKELEEKKAALDKLADEYEKKKNSADVNLAKSEKALYAYWKNIINNNKSSKSDLESSIAALESVKGQLKSKEALKDIEALISTAQEKVSMSDTNNIDISSTTGDANKVLTYATKFLGYPYVWGAKGPDKFDCSGLVQYVFKNSVGIELPESTYGQVECGTTVAYEDMKPGDIVFMRESSRGPEHVGIYIGNGKIIHAADSKRGVIIGNISKFMVAKRVLTD